MKELLSRLFEMAQKGEGMPLEVAERLSQIVIDELESMGVKDIEVLGSQRRKSPIVGDVDIVVFDSEAGLGTWKELRERLADKGYEIKTRFVDTKGKEREMPMGPSQMSFFLDGANVDVKVHNPELRGAMMVHFTGSKIFNIGMRSWLKRFGWSFSQAGLKNEKGKIVAAKTEEDIFKAMGMDFVPPEDRERFPTPKTPPPGAGRKREYYSSNQQPSSQEESIPAEIYAKLPDEVKAKIKDFELPRKDKKGNWIPRDFLWNKQARHKYYRAYGTFRIPTELKLDYYLEK